MNRPMEVPTTSRSPPQQSVSERASTPNMFDDDEEDYIVCTPATPTALFKRLFGTDESSDDDAMPLVKRRRTAVTPTPAASVSCAEAHTPALPTPMQSSQLPAADPRPISPILCSGGSGRRKRSSQSRATTSSIQIQDNIGQTSPTVELSQATVNSAKKLNDALKNYESTIKDASISLEKYDQYFLQMDKDEQHSKAKVVEYKQLISDSEKKIAEYTSRLNFAKAKLEEHTTRLGQINVTRKDYIEKKKIAANTKLKNKRKQDRLVSLIFPGYKKSNSAPSDAT